MQLNTIPATIHNIYNPVIFEFSATSINRVHDKIAILCENDQQVLATHNIGYYKLNNSNENTAHIDLRLLLASFFQSPENKFKQSLKYSVLYSYKGEGDLLSTSYNKQSSCFLAVRSVAQIGGDTNLEPRLHKLLTPFRQLSVYDYYPADVSVLASPQTICTTNNDRHTFTNDEVARIDISCDNQYIKVEGSLHYTAKWNVDSYTCLQASAGSSDPAAVQPHPAVGRYDRRVYYNNRLYMSSGQEHAGIKCIDESGNFRQTNITEGMFIASFEYQGSLFFIRYDQMRLYYLDNEDDTIKPYTHDTVNHQRIQSAIEFNNKIYLTDYYTLWQVGNSGQLIRVVNRALKILGVFNNCLFMNQPGGAVYYLTTDHTLVQTAILRGSFTGFEEYNGKHYLIDRLDNNGIWVLNTSNNSLEQLYSGEINFTYSNVVNNKFYLGSRDEKGLWIFNTTTNQPEKYADIDALFCSFGELNGQEYFGTATQNGIWYLDNTDQQIKLTQAADNVCYEIFKFNNTLYFNNPYRPSFYSITSKHYFTGNEAATTLTVSTHYTIGGEPVDSNTYDFLSTFSINAQNYSSLSADQYSLLTHNEIRTRADAFILYVEQCENHHPIVPVNSLIEENSNCINQHITLDGVTFIRKEIEADGSITLTLIASDDWHAIDVPLWISLSQTSGAAGIHTITVQSVDSSTTERFIANIAFQLNYYDYRAVCNITQEKKVIERPKIYFKIDNADHIHSSYSVLIYKLDNNEMQDIYLPKGECKEFEWTFDGALPFEMTIKSIPSSSGSAYEGGQMIVIVDKNAEILGADNDQADVKIVEEGTLIHIILVPEGEGPIEVPDDYRL